MDFKIENVVALGGLLETVYRTLSPTNQVAVGVMCTSSDEIQLNKCLCL